MIIKVLGSGCTNCQNLEKATPQALADLGLDATVEQVTDSGDIASYGVMRTPGAGRRRAGPGLRPRPRRRRDHQAAGPGQLTHLRPSHTGAFR